MFVLSINFDKMSREGFQIKDGGVCKGLGVFVTKDTEAGTKILSEPALVKVTVPHTAKTLAKFIAQLRKEVTKLEEDNQEKFFLLHNARPELCTKNRGKRSNKEITK